MSRLKFLESAEKDLKEIAGYIEETSGSREVAKSFNRSIIAKCQGLARLTAQVGRERRELLPEIRSVPFKNYVVFVRYLPSNSDRQIFEVVNILEGHRDFIAFFTGDDVE